MNSRQQSVLYLCGSVNEQLILMCITIAKGVESNGKQFLRIVCVYQQANELYEQQRSEKKTKKK